MTFETTKQIAAGIALAEMTANEFAKEAGMTPTTLSRIMNSDEALMKMQADTRRRLEHCFSLHGIEFMPGGARVSERTTIVLSGKEGFAEFRQRVLAEAKTDNADICVFNVDERHFDRWGEGEVNDYYRSEMAKLRKDDPNLKFRCLVKEGDRHLSAARHSDYKWVNEENFSSIPYYIYGENAASMVFTDKSCDIVIIRVPQYVEEQRRLFNRMWKKAKDLEFDPTEGLPK